MTGKEATGGGRLSVIYAQGVSICLTKSNRCQSSSSEYVDDSSRDGGKIN